MLFKILKLSLLLTSPVVQIVEVGRLEVLQLELEVLEQRPPLGVGLDLGLRARDPESEEAADGRD